MAAYPRSGHEGSPVVEEVIVSTVPKGGSQSLRRNIPARLVALGISVTAVSVESSRAPT
jgi:hypothetical protein